MKCFAVIDTNVLVSSLLTKNMESATIGVIKLIASGIVVPVFSKEILKEYDEVLHRKKFRLSEDRIQHLLDIFTYFGLEIAPNTIDEILPDPKDMPFYEVTMEIREDKGYLVTGNKKHFPVKPYIVDAREFLSIVEQL